jgi:hypothetical protein
METQLFWIIALIVVGVGAFSLGTRTRKAVAQGDCEVDTHWWFGWWVRCEGGKACPSGNCKLQTRVPGSDRWSDADVVPGGSVRWREGTGYRCVCA